MLVKYKHKVGKSFISKRRDRAFQLIGAYYGNEKAYSSAMQKMEHYEYFKWNRIEVNHENFPSNPASDAPLLAAGLLTMPRHCTALSAFPVGPWRDWKSRKEKWSVLLS